MSSKKPTYDAGVERGVRPIGVWSTSTARSRCSTPVERAVRADAAGREAERAAHAAVEHVAHERRLAGAGDAGDAGPGAERDADVDVLQVVLARAADRRASRASSSGRARARRGVRGAAR